MAKVVLGFALLFTVLPAHTGDCECWYQHCNMGCMSGCDPGDTMTLFTPDAPTCAAKAGTCSGGTKYGACFYSY